MVSFDTTPPDIQSGASTRLASFTFSAFRFHGPNSCTPTVLFFRYSSAGIHRIANKDIPLRQIEMHRTDLDYPLINITQAISGNETGVVVFNYSVAPSHT